MSNVNLKKLIIPNIPYLLFVYLFDKVAQAARFAPGADFSTKVLHIGDGFTAAFSSLVPSFDPLDMLVGIAGAVILRLIVYVKGKNAKKYRKNVEYGSARWGNAEDIKPYTDPVFENNVLLTQTERLTMNSRPKQPKYARNKNILVIGGSGSGKTRFFVKPNLMQMHSSYVVTDPNGTVIIEFEVDGAGRMDLIGSSYVVVQEKSGSNWVGVSTYWGSSSNGMLGENTVSHIGKVTYSGTKGKEYRAIVTVYAENATGDDSRTIITNSVTAK